MTAGLEEVSPLIELSLKRGDIDFYKDYMCVFRPRPGECPKVEGCVENVTCPLLIELKPCQMNAETN